MELCVIGSGTGVPSLTRGAPSLLLRLEEKNLVVDTGSCSLRQLLRLGISYHDIDYLCYTHIHPDHTADLLPFLFTCNYGEVPRRKELKIIGGKGFKDFFTKLQGVYGQWIVPQTYSLKLIELSDDSLVFDGFTIRSKPMKHIGTSIGFRVETTDGKSLTISGDTDYCPELIALARHSDLLVSECSFPDEKKAAGHLTPTLAGKIATQCQCKRLLLVHLYPVCDKYDILSQCQTQFAGEIIIGEDLKRVVV